MKEIVRLILAKTPAEEIARRITPSVSKHAIDRYRTKLKIRTDLPLPCVKSDTSVSKQWVEAEYVEIVTSAKARRRPDLASARAALDSIARLNGYDAPRRTESVSLNLHALPSAQLAIALQSAVAGLPEHERKALLADHTIDIEPTE